MSSRTKTSVSGFSASRAISARKPGIQTCRISRRLMCHGINFAPQLGVTNGIDNNDARIQSVVYRNGFLWFTHTIFLPGGTSAATRSAVQWWQVNPLDWSIVQRGLIDDPDGVTFYA